MFQNKNLSVLAMIGGADWTEWVYRDPYLDVADMEKVGFFNQVKSIMNTGDLIILVGKDTVKQKYVFIHQGEVILEELGK